MSGRGAVIIKFMNMFQSPGGDIDRSGSASASVCREHEARMELAARSQNEVEVADGDAAANQQLKVMPISACIYQCL